MNCIAHMICFCINSVCLLHKSF